jgi:putative spermidine/putrescine transport system substrate-binding protein
MFRTRMFLAATTLAYGLTLGAVLAAEPLSVMSFGGAYQQAQRKAVFDAYSEETGQQISEQEYGGEIAKIKAMIDSGNTTIDVVDVDAPTLLQGCDEGLFETIDWEKIGPKSEWLAGTTSDCGVGTIVYATILSYDQDKLEKPPMRLADLFDLAGFPGKRGLWKNPATNLEFALLADGVAPQDVYATLATPEGIDRAFSKLDTIKSQIVWWEAGAQAPQLLASGEVTMTTAWNGRIFNANKEGRNFGIVWDNQILDSNYWVIPKGAKDLEKSLAFIHFAVEPKVLAGIAKYIPYGPVRTTAAAEVTPEDAESLPTSPANLTASLTLDNAFWADHGDEIRKRFTTWLSN